MDPENDQLVKAVALAARYLDRSDFLRCLYVNSSIRYKLLHSECVLSIVRHSPNSQIDHGKFWRAVLMLLRIGDIGYDQSQDYCFELAYDDLSDVIPNYHGERLMKDEYIDGEITRDVVRTFHCHSLFHYKENRGQDVLEAVLRSISDNFFSLGYCQGMNYVAGAAMVALVDPHLFHYVDKTNIQETDTSCVIKDVALITDQTYQIMTGLIFHLQLIRLWGYGFPDISLYSYAFNYFLQEYCPSIPSHLHSIGWDLSIIVARWFIPLFSDCVPFSCLFRLWDYLFIYGFCGLFRVSISLFKLHEEAILKCDIVTFSELLNHICKEYLKEECHIQTLFSTMQSLPLITDIAYASLQQQFVNKHPIQYTKENEQVRVQLSEDISMLYQRIQTIRHIMSEEKREILEFLKEKESFSTKLIYLQEQKGRLTQQYDEQFTQMQESSSVESRLIDELIGEEDASAEEFRLRTVSRQLTAVGMQIRECDCTLQQLELNIICGIESE